MRPFLAILAWVSIACGGGGVQSNVDCSVGTPLGKAPFLRVYQVGLVGDGLAVIEDGSSGEYSVLLVDLDRLSVIDEWLWDRRGTVIGPAATPALLSRPNTTYRRIDPMTGSLGEGTEVASRNATRGVSDWRVLGQELHVVVRGEHFVFDVDGGVIRTTEELPESRFTNRFVLLEEAIVGLRADTNALRLRQWGLSGDVIRERIHGASDFGVDTVENFRVTRLGQQPVLVDWTDETLQIFPIDDTLGVGDASVVTDMPDSPRSGSFLARPQGGGASIASARRDGEEVTIAGAHIDGDGVVSHLDVTCIHPFVGPAIRVLIPAEAPHPTWVWHIGSDLWIHTE